MKVKGHDIHYPFSVATGYSLAFLLPHFADAGRSAETLLLWADPGRGGDRTVPGKQVLKFHSPHLGRPVPGEAGAPSSRAACSEGGVSGASEEAHHLSSSFHRSQPEQLKGKAFLHCQHWGRHSQVPRRSRRHVGVGSGSGLPGQLLSTRWVCAQSSGTRSAGCPHSLAMETKGSRKFICWGAAWDH